MVHKCEEEEDEEVVGVPKCLETLSPHSFYCDEICFVSSIQREEIISKRNCGERGYLTDGRSDYKEEDERQDMACETWTREQCHILG